MIAFPSRIRRLVQERRPLAPLTTLRVGGAARYFVEANSLRDVADTLEACRAQGLPLRVLGGGSNVLIAERGVEGMVLSLAKMRRIATFGHKVHAQAGASLGALVTRCARAGIAGPEGLSGIPGSLGGALAMNAGGQYGEIADFVERVVWINPQGELQSLYREEIEFSYRRSQLSGGVVIEAILSGHLGEAGALLARASRITREKRARQPYSVLSAGCCFKNPKGNSAGRLIDLAGCKGMKVGDAMVSRLHGNFIVNRGGAGAGEILKLMRQVRARVFDHHGVKLEAELKIWPEESLTAA